MRNMPAGGDPARYPQLHSGVRIRMNNRLHPHPSFVGKEGRMVRNIPGSNMVIIELDGTPPGWTFNYYVVELDVIDETGNVIATYPD